MREDVMPSLTLEDICKESINGILRIVEEANRPKPEDIVENAMKNNELFSEAWMFEDALINGIDYMMKLTNRTNPDVAMEAKEAFGCSSLTEERMERLRKGEAEPTMVEEKVLSCIFGIPKESLMELSEEERQEIRSKGMRRYTILLEGKKHAIYTLKKSEYLRKKSMDHLFYPEEQKMLYYMPNLHKSYQERAAALDAEEQALLEQIEGNFGDAAPDVQVTGKRKALPYLELLSGLMRYRTCCASNVVMERSTRVDVLCYALAKVFGCEFCLTDSFVAASNAAQIDELAKLIDEFLTTKLNPGGVVLCADAPEEEKEDSQENNPPEEEKEASAENDLLDEVEEIVMGYFCTVEEAVKRLEEKEFSESELTEYADAMRREEWGNMSFLNYCMNNPPRILATKLSKEDGVLREYLIELIRRGEIS